MKHITDEKTQEIARLTNLPVDVVESGWLYYDWGNSDEHEQWIQEASADEIADWILSCMR